MKGSKGIYTEQKEKELLPHSEPLWTRLGFTHQNRSCSSFIEKQLNLEVRPLLSFYFPLSLEIELHLPFKGICDAKSS